MISRAIPLGKKGPPNTGPLRNLDNGLQLGNWYPRFTVSGPIRRDRVWFSEALSLQHNLKVVKELPKNGHTTTQWSGDSLFRSQVNITAANRLQMSFL